MNLYTTHSKQFDRTRQAAWRGWGRIVGYFSDRKNLSVLDIGCGNGRFYKFLSENNIDISNYLGIDNSEEMINLFKENLKFEISNSQKNLSNVEFQTVDVNSLNWMQSISNKFDLIVAFGLTHHIETKESRENFYKNISNLLNPDGILILTFWQFEKITNLMKDAEPLGDNNFSLRFGENISARFAHNYPQNELKEWQTELEKNFDLVEKFEEDGRSGDLNLYLVLKRRETRDEPPQATGR